MIFFDKNLKYLRQQRGWKQEYLATQLHVKPNTISNYEKGKSNPDFKMLDEIVKILGVSVNDILYIDMEKDGNGANELRKNTTLSGRPGATESSEINPFDFMKTVLLQLQQMQNEIKEIKKQIDNKK